MPRRKAVNFIRPIGKDPLYGSEVIQKLINIVMLCGKKNIARTIVYDAIDLIIKKTENNKEKGLDVFNKALEQLMPSIEVRPRRVGGSVYQVPIEVKSRRKNVLAMRWLIKAASSRSNKTMGQRLAYELLDAYEGKGAAYKKKTDVHRMAEANRAFAYFAW